MTLRAESKIAAKNMIARGTSFTKYIGFAIMQGNKESVEALKAAFPGLYRQYFAYGNIDFQPQALVPSAVLEYLSVSIRDIGLSAATILFATTGIKVMDIRKGYLPYDSSDFGRCYRLMKACPMLDIDRLSDRYPEFHPFVEAWPELTHLYDNDTDGLHEKLRKITRGLNNQNTQREVLPGEDRAYI